MITLSWWVFAGALLLAAIVGGLGMALLFALPRNAPDAPETVEEDEWGGGL